LEGFSRGLIDTRDVVYFLSVTAVCLAVAFRALERRKWA
jgi:ABC-2 type transport system permease protein